MVSVDPAHAFFGIRPWKRNSIFSVAVICILCGLAGCSAAPVVGSHDGSASRTEVIYVISGGWHTQLGLPVGAINGPLANLKAEFPSAGYLVFGWGARDYYMARDPGIGEILRAVASGPAVMARNWRETGAKKGDFPLQTAMIGLPEGTIGYRDFNHLGPSRDKRAIWAMRIW